MTKSVYSSDMSRSSGSTFIGKNEDSSRTKLESRNTNFPEKEFSCTREIIKDVQFFKVADEPTPHL